MTLDPNDRNTLIHYRIEQAKNTRDDAEFLIQHDKLTIAVNRIYYAMFYMLSALALKHGFSTSKHKQLIGWFNKHFVKDGTIEPKYAKIVSDAFEKRSDSDYGMLVNFTRDEVQEMFTELNDFIATIEQLLLSQ